MSDSGSGFDWISILAIIVAGGISIIKGLSKKTKREEPPVRREPEYTYEDEEPEESTIVEEYNDTVLKKEPVFSSITEPTFFGDYYKKPEPQKEEPFFGHEHILEEPEEEVAYDFDIRQAIIASEILRRPQY